MRTVLRALDLPADLKAFLRDGTADDIRRRIFRPIRWLGSGPSHDEIERDLHEHLVHFGNALGVGAQDFKNALSALIVELLACVRRPPEWRYVTAADLLTVFQKNTWRLAPPSVLQGVTPALAGADDLADTALATRDAASIPLPPRAAVRPDLVQDLHGTLVANGVLWLHGSSGLGKTTLALLLARYQNAPWVFADLRDLEPRALRLVLVRLSATFGASEARGLILDDLPADPDNATILAIRRVARAAANADGLLVVTGAKPPPPSLVGGTQFAEPRCPRRALSNGRRCRPNREPSRWRSPNLGPHRLSLLRGRSSPTCRSPCRRSSPAGLASRRATRRSCALAGQVRRSGRGTKGGSRPRAARARHRVPRIAASSVSDVEQF